MFAALGFSLLVSACTGDIKEVPRSSLIDTANNGYTAACQVDPAQCPPHQQAPVCTDGSCVCSTGLSACGTACVSLSTDAANCGQCGLGCGVNGVCNAGQCACSGTAVACNGACLELRSDPLHCGTCDRACASGEICDGGQCMAATSNTCVETCGGGRSCVAGTCACPVGQTFCGSTCVDTQTASTDCGGCGQACGTGQACAAGSCNCPVGQLACGDACVDTQTSVTDCGGCDQACAQGESCMAGACHGTLGADGCSGSARSISIREIAVYQSIKVAIASAQSAIAPGDRVADVIAGRKTLVRVFVHPEAGFAARELSARLTLDNGGIEDQYFAKQVVNGDSTDAAVASTFAISVPADKIDVDTRYSLELVECGADPGTGNMVAPRFPASGNAELGARETGVLKIAIVPVLANGRLPDTSDSALAVYRDYLMAMYPVRDVELHLATQIETDYPIQWVNLLTQISQKRAADKPAGDVYYYGFVKPSDADTLLGSCQGGCTAGIGYIGEALRTSLRAAVGLAYADQDSASTMAHEVGHNHGREHAPCAPGGNIQDVDAKFPYAGALTGVWGFDSRSNMLIDPSRTTDIMGYCNRKWISDYTYRGLIEHAATVNANFFRVVPDASLAAYRVLIVEDGMPRWSKPFDEPVEAYGEPEVAEALDAAGQVSATLTVYRTRIGDVDASTLLVPEPEASWHSLRVSGSPAIAFQR